MTKPDMEHREVPVLPKDSLLAYLLHNFPAMVFKYHDHDSLLECKSEQDLSEEEKADAWAVYEADVKRKNETNLGPYNNNYGMMPSLPGLGTYANSLYGNYNNLSNALNYSYNSPFGHFNPYANDYNPLAFSQDYSSFYKNLMSLNYDQNTPNLLSPTHSTSVTNPSSLMNNFTSARNWMQSSASTSNFGNSLLSSLAQTSSSSSKTNTYNSYINDLYHRLGGTNPILPTSNASPSNSKSPPSILPSTSHDYDLAAFLKHNQMSNFVGATITNSITNTTQTSALAANANPSHQQGPNARNNPMLSKELMLPTRNPNLDNTFNTFSSIPTSVTTKPMINTNSTAATTNTTTTGSANGSKTNDVGVTSSNDKSNEKNSNAMAKKVLAQEPQISVKNVSAINNSMRKSPDTTNNSNQASNLNKSTDKPEKVAVSNDVSSTVSETAKKSNSSNVNVLQRKTATNSTSNIGNMGIVYPQQKTMPSTSKTIPNTSISLTKITNHPKQNFTDNGKLQNSLSFQNR